MHNHRKNAPLGRRIAFGTLLGTGLLIAAQPGCFGNAGGITPSSFAEGDSDGALEAGGGQGTGSTPIGVDQPPGTSSPSANGNGTPAVVAPVSTVGGPGAKGRGATVPYWEFEAEAAQTNGKLLAPSRTFGDIAAEASGRSAVQLTAQGDKVQFTTQQPTNSIVVRYSIPDAPSGGGMNATLGLYVGDKRLDLPLTSRYAWTYGDADAQGVNSENPGAGTPHHYFDEAHLMFAEVPAGTVIKLQKDAQDSAASYVIDLIDLELVAAPLPQPAGSISVADYGAIADDGKDDGAALQAAIAAGRSAKKVVYLPKGVYDVAGNGPGGSTTFKLNVSEATLQGAGMWHTVIKGFGAQIQLSGSNNVFADFALFGDVTYRDDSKGWQGFDGPAGTGSSMTNLWIEHQTAGIWLGKGAFVGQVTAPLTDGLKITGLRVRNTYADGIRFANGTSNSTLTQSTFRNTGDDGLGSWSFAADGPLPCRKNTYTFNTVQAPWRANCIAFYGGADEMVSDNVCTDTSNYPGLLISTAFSAIAFSGTNTFARNTLTRAGGPHYGQPHGALKIFADSQPVSGIRVSDTVIDAATFSALEIVGGQQISDVTLDKVVMTSPASQGIWVVSGARGQASITNSSVTGAGGKAYQSDAQDFMLTLGSGNAGF